mgnify:CR=1 FL=1
MSYHGKRLTAVFARLDTCEGGQASCDPGALCRAVPRWRNTQLYFSCNTRLHSHRFADRRLVHSMLEPVTLHFRVRRAPKLSAPLGDVVFARHLRVRGAPRTHRDPESLPPECPTKTRDRNPSPMHGEDFKFWVDRNALIKYFQNVGRSAHGLCRSSFT